MGLVRKLLRHRVLTLIGVILVAAAGGGYAYAHAGSTTTQYRTAAVALGTIEQTLSLTGNLTPITQSNVNFQVSGTVTSVDVSVGQAVTAGQVLATIDATTMQATLTQAQASLAAAEAKLSSDESSSSTTNATQNLATARTNLSNDRTAYSDVLAVNAQTITSDENAIAADRAAVSADNTAVANDQQTWNTDGCGASSPSSNCPTDSQNLSAAEQQQAKDNQAATVAQNTLQNDQVRTKQADDQAAAKVASDQTALSNALLGTSSTSQQAAIAQDTASLAQAQQAVTNDTNAVTETSLLAPNGGTVAAINLTVGNTVGSSSSAAASSSSPSSSNVIILTPGVFQVTGTISDSQVNQVAIGQHAVVTAAGTTAGLPGVVTSVGQIASISSGVATFPVTVQVTGNHPSLRDGMSASISIIINRVVGVLTVPTSAVHTTGGTSTVQVLKNGVATSVAVTTGAADASRTEIQSGLSAGDTVIIAVVTGTIPTTTTTGGGGAGGRGFGAGGGGGGAGIAIPGGG